MSVYGFKILADDDIPLVKAELRKDVDFPDDLIIASILDAEALVLDYITDVFEDGKYPRSVQKAVRLLCGALNADLIGNVAELKNGNYLPERVCNMLFAYRTPTAI